jgi:hypothetical protein
MTGMLKDTFVKQTSLVTIKLEKGGENIGSGWEIS